MPAEPRWPPAKREGGDPTDTSRCQGSLPHIFEGSGAEAPTPPPGRLGTSSTSSPGSAGRPGQGTAQSQAHPQPRSTAGQPRAPSLPAPPPAADFAAAPRWRRAPAGRAATLTGGRGGTGTGRLLLEAVAPPSRPVPSLPVSFHFISFHPIPSRPGSHLPPSGSRARPPAPPSSRCRRRRFSASPALPGPAPLPSAPGRPHRRTARPAAPDAGRGGAGPRIPAAPSGSRPARCCRPAPPAPALRGSRGSFVWGWRRQGSEETPACCPLNVYMLSTKRNNATYSTRFGFPHPVLAGSGWCGGCLSACGDARGLGHGAPLAPTPPPQSLGRTDATAADRLTSHPTSPKLMFKTYSVLLVSIPGLSVLFFLSGNVVPITFSH